ncbi:MAG: TetR/AcrR family transcriptional regulator [Hyphomonadaceae bacterium]|nr:TetR/AcrR family transcriptional regulator [Hyphomonadaceae bacterium]
MARTRLNGADRRSSILEAASAVFAEYGYDGAKTQQIAKAAKVSEALVYRHFPTKLALYKAVLRKVIQDQDDNIKNLGVPMPSTNSLIATIESFILSAVEGGQGPGSAGTRILFASLAGDGDYARLVYKRAAKYSLKPFAEAVQAARDAGDIVGTQLSATNMHAFLEHVGSMITIARLPDKAVVAYDGDKQRIAREAVYFICRGIGVTEAAIARYYAASAKKRSAKAS